ncbi:hypothetical protein PHSY_003263 [Pseudozyma hubeiensis SY62]|uniref:Uncharacterized protein n=1 Tax=Pseudozyma hubeiensis (strain SY62) TaxID=1305764 RepID=R9P351_PSEHS|nr:hypothetical protein PHSY_003263 [Pseudozyma hubeiensis SY62]GAC95687.1 hypothetical protein PHSY_003263 [Pseudozyma hubeiensis SY62]
MSLRLLGESPPPGAGTEQDTSQETDMTTEQPRHCDWDVLVFFLTSKLSQEERQEIVGLIEGEEFKDRLVTVDWPYERSGTQEDIDRLARQADVEGKPFGAMTVVFIDDESPRDKKVIMTDSEDGGIRCQKRLLASYAASTAIACNLCCMALEDATDDY